MSNPFEFVFITSRHTAPRPHGPLQLSRRAAPGELEQVALDWAGRITAKSPTAVRMLKYAFNMIDDGMVGQHIFAGEATRLAYATDEAAEGRAAFLEKRPPDFRRFPWHF